MRFPRRSGVLLHPSSLPGSYGIGEIGPDASRFVDTLHGMGQTLWQVLPLGPTSFGNSPYQSPSTFACNPLLISFDALVEEGLLPRERLTDFPLLPAQRVDYGAAIPARFRVLREVCDHFERRATPVLRDAFDAFCSREAGWLESYALFQALKEGHNLAPWIHWPRPLALRQKRALAEARERYAPEIAAQRVLQFLFDWQWRQLREHGRARGVQIIGDIPIFVAHDSADVWANPSLFHLDDGGRPTVQAGVPPDYFSATGQLWGNPLYRWDLHRDSGFAWWTARVRRVLELVDIVRIDHFRGFQAYWEIPAGAATAVDGRWAEGPGADLFDAMLAQLGQLPIIAEDLGVITEEVEALRDLYAFPGMRILQFAFGPDPQAEGFRPAAVPENCVVYTGTHDNDTTVGWFRSKPGRGSTRTAAAIRKERQAIREYFGTNGSDIHWRLIDEALRSAADTAIVPLQDVLGLGSEARMNLPGESEGNWEWRYAGESLTGGLQQQLRHLTEQTGRAPWPVPQPAVPEAADLG